MLRQHRVHVKGAADVVGRVNGANLDVRLVACGEDGAQVLGRNREHGRTGNRIARDAAPEIAELAVGRPGALAKEVDEGGDLAAGSPRIVRTLAMSQFSPTVILTWLPTWPDMAIDGSLWDWSAIQRGGVHANLRTRTGDFHDLADRGEGCAQAVCRNRCFLREVADFVEEFAQVRLIVHVRALSALNHWAMLSRERLKLT